MMRLSRAMFFVAAFVFLLTVRQFLLLNFTSFEALLESGSRVAVYVLLTVFMLSGMRFVPARELYVYEFLGTHFVLPAGPWWLFPWMTEVLQAATTDDMPIGEEAKSFFKPIKARTKGGAAVEVHFTVRRMRIPNAEALEAMLRHVPVQEFKKKKYDIARRNIVETVTAVFESMVSQEDLRSKEVWPQKIVEVENEINKRLRILFENQDTDLWYELEINVTVPISEAEIVAKRRDEAAAIEQFVTTLVKQAVSSGLFKTEEEARRHAIQLAALKFGAEAIGDSIGRALSYHKPDKKRGRKAPESEGEEVD